MIFGNRLSWVQRVMNITKDPWTHAAVVANVGADLRTVELGPDGCFSRSIDEFTSAYRIVGIARPAMSPTCRGAIGAAAASVLASAEISYSWRTAAVLQTVALARTCGPALIERLTIRLGARLAERVARRIGPDQLTCSGFVDRCLAAACETCAPAPLWPVRPRLAPWRTMPDAADICVGVHRHRIDSRPVVRFMTTPTDLWAAGCWASRTVVRGADVTVVADPSRLRRACRQLEDRTVGNVERRWR